MTGQCDKSSLGRSEINREIPYEIMSRDVETAHPLVRPRTHAAGGVGEVRYHANGRRALAHHRWTSTGLAALHAARLRPPTPISAAQAEFTGPTSAANLRLSPSSPLLGTVPCSADLWLARTENQNVTRVLAASCGSRVRNHGRANPGFRPEGGYRPSHEGTTSPLYGQTWSHHRLHQRLRVDLSDRARTSGLAASRAQTATRLPRLAV